MKNKFEGLSSSPIKSGFVGATVGVKGRPGLSQNRQAMSNKITMSKLDYGSPQPKPTAKFTMNQASLFGSSTTVIKPLVNMKPASITGTGLGVFGNNGRSMGIAPSDSPY